MYWTTFCLLKYFSEKAPSIIYESAHLLHHPLIRVQPRHEKKKVQRLTHHKQTPCLSHSVSSAWVSASRPLRLHYFIVEFRRAW